MKKNETREETLGRLARDADKGPKATKQFTRLVKAVARVAKSEMENVRQARRETRQARREGRRTKAGNGVKSTVLDVTHGQCSILMPMQRTPKAFGVVYLILVR